MIDTNPFRTTIRYRSGAVDSFTTKEVTTRYAGGDLTSLRWDSAKPQLLYVRLEEIVSVRSSRRFPWGLFA